MPRPTRSRCTPDATRKTEGRPATRVGVAAAALVLAAALARGQEAGTVAANVAQAPPPDPESPASSPPEKRFDVHFQFTSVTQYHPDFPAPYSGQNSMDPDAEHETTVTATLFLGARLWKGAELYVNPEMSGGKGLSSTFGIAGFPNGDAFRVGSPEPHIYIARAMLKQTFPLDGETEPVEDEPNQLGGTRPVRRWTITVGKFGLSDFFDANPYSGDARSQFMNWAAWTAGAWDYAADTRGYTYGFVIERYDADWAARFAGAAEPLVANGEQLDHDLLHAYSLTAEYERGYTLAGKQGTARLLFFYNRANMGNYDEANAEALATGEPADIVATRQVGRAKWGFIVNADLSLGGPWGLFFRGSWNDGANESWAYAEIERSASAGVLRKGPFAGRPNDEAGLALMVNGLGAGHREYLALGGYGFMIGDGRLNYGLETIAEIFYQAALIEHLWFAADYQFVANPAYNRDRGPVNVLGARLHVEF